MGDFISFSSIKFKSHTNAGPFTWEEVLPSRKVYRDIQEHLEADKGEITELDHTGAGNGMSNYFKRCFLRKQVFENNKQSGTAEGS